MNTLHDKKVAEVEQGLKNAIKQAFRVQVDVKSLESLLMSLNVSGNELARRAGISHTGLHKLLRAGDGANPTLETLEALADGLCHLISEKAQGEGLSRSEVIQYISRRVQSDVKERLRVKLHTKPREAYREAVRGHRVASLDG